MSRLLIITDSAGKRRAWEEHLRRTASDGEVVVTNGQICEFPRRLTPLGISLQNDKIDYGREMNQHKRDEIIRAVEDSGVSGRIYIATDKDVEGDSLALDILNVIAEAKPGWVARCYRAHAKSLTSSDVAMAVETAESIKEAFQKIKDDAVEGRTRAVTDRWIGAAFSKKLNARVGRVRSAIPGMALVYSARPEKARGPVEIGEIVMMARSAAGGLPFRVRVPVMSLDDKEKTKALVRIAERCRNKLIPGSVMPAMSLSAAVADRFTNVRPFSTGDAVAHASRHYPIRPYEAMRGLVKAYYRGDVSYPRTDSRSLSPESASRIARLGASCEIYGLSASDAVEINREDMSQNEALHPVCEVNVIRVRRLRELIRRDWEGHFSDKTDDEKDQDDVADLMTALVARRAFEAAKSSRVERGFWRPGNGSSVMSHEEADLLEDLEWERESGIVFPWTRHSMTRVGAWPKETVLLDMMMTEELGRPSSLPGILRSVTDDGEIDMSMSGTPDYPFSMPSLTRSGADAARRTPRFLLDPASARKIYRAISNAEGCSSEAEKDTVDVKIRKRLSAWLDEIDEPSKDVLFEFAEQN